MSRFEELVAEHCPDGVPFKTLAELLEYEQPTKYLVASEDYDDSHPTPVLTPGQTFILGRTAETDGIYGASPQRPVILFDDFTTAFRWVDFPFKVKSSAVKLLRPRVGAAVNFRFAHYAMQCIPFVPSEHSRHWISKYSAFRIPVPPIEVQDEVVRTLDMFSQLEAELEAELEARQRQCEHYQARLLTFEAASATCPSGVPFRRLSEVARLRNGRDYKSHAAGQVPVYGSGGVMTHIDTAAHSGPSVLIPRKGSLRNVFFVDGPFWNVDTIFYTEIDQDTVVPKYLFYMLKHLDLARLNNSGGVPSLTQGLLGAVELPVPALEVQLEVVRVLDTLQAVCASLEVEIAARRKQYEYYRERLLTFKELES